MVTPLLVHLSYNCLALSHWYLKKLLICVMYDLFPNNLNFFLFGWLVLEPLLSGHTCIQSACTQHMPLTCCQLHWKLLPVSPQKTGRFQAPSLDTYTCSYTCFLLHLWREHLVFPEICYFCHWWYLSDFTGELSRFEGEIVLPFWSISTYILYI